MKVVNPIPLQVPRSEFNVSLLIFLESGRRVLLLLSVNEIFNTFVYHDKEAIQRESLRLPVVITHLEILGCNFQRLFNPLTEEMR